jgi:hypothetical protein
MAAMPVVASQGTAGSTEPANVAAPIMATAEAGVSSSPMCSPAAIEQEADTAPMRAMGKTRRG